MLRAEAASEHIAQAGISTSWIVEVVATGSRDGKPFQPSISSTPACAPPQEPC